MRGERWAPPRGAARTPPARARARRCGGGTIEGAGRAGRLSRPSGALPASGRARGWPERAQSTEPIPGRPGRLARGPMAQPSCAWLKRRRESSGGRRGKEGGGDAMRRGLIGGVERGGAKRQLSYREASTGDIVRHAGGRGLSHRPPGRLEGPCSPRHEALLAGAWKDSSGPQSATWSGRQLWGWKSGLSAGGAAGSGLARVLAARLRTMCPRRSSHVGLRHRGVRGAVEKRESSFGEPLARHVSGRNGHPARRGRREKSTAADIWWRPTSARGC